jgi:transposase
VICEATGGYEATLLLAAAAAGVPAHLSRCPQDPGLHPFARYARQGLDARGIACYGLERHAQLPRWTPRKGALTDLQAFIRLRAQLVTQRAGRRSLLQAPNSEAVKGHVHTMIKHLDHQIQAVEDDIAARLHDERCVSETVARIEQIPGCGRLTAITLAVLMPELGRLTRRQAAALAGLAPDRGR